MPSKLPPAPDFAAIESISSRTALQRTEILALIGNLIFTWSNNESMFLYLLMILLETDFEAAAITFVSLNTTRARLDLIRRLAKARLKDAQTIDKVEGLIERFNDCTKIRNEFNHCIYQLNEKGAITHTNVLRLSETRQTVQFAVTREFDDKRRREIVNTVRKLTTLNRDLWSFLPELENKVRAGRSKAAATHKA